MREKSKGCRSLNWRSPAALWAQIGRRGSFCDKSGPNLGSTDPVSCHPPLILLPSPPSSSNVNDFPKFAKICGSFAQFTYQAGLVIRMSALHCGDQLEQLCLLHFPTAARVVDLQTWKIHFSRFFIGFLGFSPILSS